VTTEITKKGPVDGDGDGWVYDGTPKKRIATPAERAAGARLRAKKAAAKKAPAAKKVAAKKAAAAKNPIEQRKQRFERAIKAVKGPADAKRVKALIDQDFVLDAKARKEMNDRLNEHLGGKPAAKKVAAPNPKKVAPKKQAPKRDLAADPQIRTATPAPKPKKKLREVAAETPQFDIEGSMDRAGKYHDRINAAKDQKELDQILRDFHDDQRIREVHRRALRVDVKRKENELAGAPKPKGAETQRRDAAEFAVKKLKQQIDAAKNVADLDAFKAGIHPNDKRAIKNYPDLLDDLNNHYRAKKQALRAAPPAPTQGSNTLHGTKTNAWKRLWNRDLGRAKTHRQLDRLEAQITSLRRQKRISAQEHDALMDAVKAKRQGIGGAHKRPSGLSSLRRRLGGHRTPAKQPTDYGNLPDGPETQAYEALHAAKNDDDVNRAVEIADKAYGAGQIDRARFDGVLDEAQKVRDRLRGNNPGRQRLSRAPAKKAVAAKPKPPPGAPQKVGPRGGTVSPPDNPGEARARAWEARMKAADKHDDPNKRLSELEQIMDELEADKDIPKEQFNKVAADLNDRMEKVDEDIAALVRIKGRFKERLKPEVQQRLDSHFGNPKNTIANAPTEGLYQYLVQSPDRFDVKRQEDNKGVSGIDVITDKVTGQRWFAKHSEFKNDFGKEKMAADILNALGISKHKAVVASGGDYERDDSGWMKPYDAPVLITQDALQGNGLDGELKRAGDMSHNDIAKAFEEVEKGLQAGDQQGLIDMLVFDYFIDNTIDRHAMNAFFQRKGGAMKVQFVDHGLGFGGVGKVDLDVGVAEWFQQRYRANNKGGWNIAKLIGDSSQGRDDVYRRLKKAIERLEKLDIDKIAAQYDKHMGGNSEAMDNFDHMIEALKARLAKLQKPGAADQLVNMIARAGGF
jgi:chaperonin cofactor prefoldin